MDDDTGLAPLCRWEASDGFSVAIVDETVVQALERFSGVTLTPLRQIADGELEAGYWEAEPWLRQIDVPLEDVPSAALAPLRAAAAARRAANEATWTTATAMRDLLGRLRVALGPSEAPADPRLLALLAEGRGSPGEDAVALASDLRQEVRDLIVMVRWAIARGASRVRLWIG